MQPTQYDIQREVEALRDLRRRSTSQGGPGALLLDPDLPNASAPPSSPNAYWSATIQPSSHSESTASGSIDDDVSSQSGRNVVDDPFNLFWVPANLHPEIAPAEFRAFLKEHARAPAGDGDGTTILGRSPSSSSTASLSRKRSMLSRQYRPSENDTGEEEEETVVPLRRNRSSYLNPAPQLTINDLQKLEQLAASASDDPAKLRNILRRSLSLNIPPADIDKMDNLPDMGDDVDSPIVVPPRNQPLRRAQRTKIRKNNLPGDGGGHRFGASRRVRGTGAATQPTDRRMSLETHSTDQAEPFEAARRRPFSNESATDYRPQSIGDEILEAYARDDDEDDEQRPISTDFPSAADVTPMPPAPEFQLPPEFRPQPEPTTIYQPQPQRVEFPPPEEVPPIQRTPSPEAPSFYAQSELDLSRVSSPQRPSPPASIPASTPPRKEGEKKGLFGMWNNKSGKKGSKDKDRESREKPEKEREPGLLGLLFSSRKRQDDNGLPFGGNASARETAHVLLGGSKSSKAQQAAATSLVGPNGMHARYPIHVERAIYRLSHIKLANPRRPLYEQVLISNLMFWYLGVINKPPTPPNAGPGAAQSNASAAEKEQREKEEERLRAENERLEKEKAEKEKAEKERLEKERALAEQKKESRRGSLTRPAASTRRAAEMPVRGPQYDLQHQVMEREYNGFMGPPVANPTPVGRSSYGPVGGAPRMGQPPGPADPPPNLPGNYYLAGSDVGGAQGFTDQPPSAQRPPQLPLQLPPGAMAPVDSQPNWLSTPPPTRRPRTSPPPLSPSGQTRYTPPADKVRLSGRSLSATAVIPPPPTSQNGGGKLRKNYSASASFSHTNGFDPRMGDVSQSEQEDVPLAILQQQQQQRR